MVSMIRRRLTGLAVVLFGVTLLSFLLASISPVDPAEAYALRVTQQPTPEQIAAIRVELGLHLPLHQQYFRWVGNLLQGDLGISYLTKKPVLSDIAEKLPVTLQLVGLALVWVALVTVPIGILTALKPGTLFDQAVRWATILGISLPSFWLGFLLLLLFTLILPVFQVVNAGTLGSLILPSLTLAVPAESAFIRLFRATLLSNLNKDYVVYARARGIRQSRIVWVHVVKNSLPPLITLFCQYVGLLVTGSAVVESLFSLPGIGMHLVNASMARDLPTVNGCVLVIALIFVLTRTAAELINARLNPKLTDKEERLYG